MNTVPAPSSFALSAALLRSSQDPSATRYQLYASGNATAQNASSVMTYETVPATPKLFTSAIDSLGAPPRSRVTRYVVAAVGSAIRARAFR